MSLVTFLNCAWVFISIAAFLMLAAAERSGARTAGTGRFQRFLAVVFLLLSLFPCVSVSDDLLGFSSFRPLQQASREANSSAPSDSSAPFQTAGETSSRTLLRLLQSLESLQLSASFVFTVWLAFFGIVALSLCENRSPELFFLPGRGPPSLAF